MIKILRRKQDKVKTVTCDNCESTLQYSEADVFKKEKHELGVIMTTHRYFGKDSSYRIGHRVRTKNIICPVCKHTITVKYYWEDLFDSNREFRVST